MTKLFEPAIESVRALSPEAQDALARFLLEVARADRSVLQLTPEEDADLAEADAEAGRGEFATDEQMLALWAKHGL